jgi:hypothetical protein
MRWLVITAALIASSPAALAADCPTLAKCIAAGFELKAAPTWQVQTVVGQREFTQFYLQKGATLMVCEQEITPATRYPLGEVGSPCKPVTDPK